jgi:hypothetical protein
MLEAGGLIKLHYHKHFELLEAFIDVNDILYYKDEPLFKNIQISSQSHNYLSKKSDGLFVNGTFLDRFSYHDDELYFDDKIVSREYTNQQITNMVNSLWTTNPYHTLGVIDYTHWLECIKSTDKELTYKNNSDISMNIKILNPNGQILTVRVIDAIANYGNTEISKILTSGAEVSVHEASNEDLNNVSIILVQ